MKSLANLNTYASQTLEVTDSRPAGVTFFVATPVEIISIVVPNRMVIPQPVKADEVINYQTANLKLRHTVKTSGPAIVGTTFSFPPGFSVPAGITVTNLANTYIEISGFTTAEQFNLFETVNWNLPANYDSYGTWWIETTITWFDGETNTTRQFAWDVYDPEYYFLSQMTSQFSTDLIPTWLSLAQGSLSSKFSLAVPYYVIYDEEVDPMEGVFSVSKALPTRIKRLFINNMPAISSSNVDNTRLRHAFDTVAISDVFDSEIKITYSPADFNILAASPATMVANVNIITDFQRFEYVYATMETDNTRLRHAFDTITFDNVLPFESNIIGIRPRVFDIETNSTFNSQSQLDRIRFSGSSISSNFESTTVASHTKSFISTTSSSFGINIAPVKTVSALSSSSINANTNTIPTRIKQLSSTFQTQTSSLNLSVINTPLLIRVIGEGNIGSPEVFSLMLRAPYDITIEWGDGTKQSFVNTGNNEVTVNKSYPIFAGSRNVSIYGSALRGFRVGNVGQIFEVVSWGRLGLENLSYCFSNSDFNISIPKFIPSTVTRIKGMFYNCINFDSENINFWDTSNITDMSYLFYKCFNISYLSEINFSSWNTSNVTNMEYMFYNTNNIYDNIGLSGWDTSKVTNMRYMFFNTPFSDDISSWNTSNVTNMDGMFMESIFFNRDISGWCVENIPTKPVNFDTGTSASWTTAKKPNWGAPC